MLLQLKQAKRAVNCMQKTENSILGGSSCQSQLTNIFGVLSGAHLNGAFKDKFFWLFNNYNSIVLTVIFDLN